MGTSSAANTPPALKSVHRKGSIDFLAIAAPLSLQNDPGHQRGGLHPGDESGGSDPDAGDALAPQAHHHRLRRQIEPGDRVEDYEEQADEIQNEYGRAFRPGLELLIVFRTLAQGANLQEGE